MQKIFDPTTAFGLVLIAVAAGLIVMIIGYVAKRMFRRRKDRQKPSKIVNQVSNGDGNIQVIGSNNYIHGGTADDKPKDKWEQ